MHQVSEDHPLVRTGLLIFADLYAAMAQHGFTPQEVDDMLVWQAGAVLQQHMRPVSTDTTPGVGTSKFREESVDILRRRLAHARGEGPKPEAEARPVSSQFIDTLQRGGEG